MKPTALGVKAALFYLLLFCAFFAAPYANLFFLLLAFLTLLGLTGLVSAARNTSGLGGVVEEIEPVPSGAAAPFHARIEGGGRPRYALAVELELEGGRRALAQAGLVAGSARVAGLLPPLPRGIYRVRAARVQSAWPFGLVRASRPLPAPGDIVVYPAPRELATTRGGGGGVGDLYDALGAADGFLQPSNLREYRPGDELRLVHWKASARRSELVIKEWEGGTGSGHEVVLDRRASPEVLEESLSIVSALAFAAKEQKEILTVHSQDLSATFGTNRRPWRELLAFLASAQPLAAATAPPPPVSPGVLRLPLARGGTA